MCSSGANPNVCGRLNATVDVAFSWALGLCVLLHKGHQREFSHFQIQEPHLSRHSIYTSKSGEAELKVRVLATKMFFYYPPKPDYVMELKTKLGWIFLKIQREAFCRVNINWTSIGDTDVQADWCLGGEGPECQVEVCRPVGAISGPAEGVADGGAGVPPPGRSWSWP